MAKTGGFIKIWRGVRDSDLWDPADEKFDRRSAFFDLLLRANHQQRTIRWGLQHLVVDPGEFITSQRSLAGAWGWGVGKVNRFLHALVREKRIVLLTIREAGHGCTKIIVCNWGLYQIRDDSSGTRDETLAERERNASGTRTGVKQEGEESKEREELQSVSHDLALLEENGDDLEVWLTRSTFSNREDLEERRVEAEGCLLLYNDLKGSSVALTSKLFHQYVNLWDIWEDPMKILDAVKGLFCDPDQWATKRNLGPEFAWKDPEIAERYVAHARDGWESGGWDKVLSMKKARRIRENE